ncbi:hypothetical protein [Actinoallomurus sp. CA-150999]|uniref:hypothetical protein n=1 Tax=Actinoallomurus sp. CA-150999 TaxID=3239887 RepID=UPI003D931174
MYALSQALFHLGGGFGVVRPLEWLHLGQLGERYLLCNPLYRAKCEHGVIWWC